ncbi:MAG: cytochrome c oxidase assembly protein [Gemmatimonadaceae bacterium]
MLLLHPAANLTATGFTVHLSTVIGLMALGGAYLWRAHRGPSLLDNVANQTGQKIASNIATPTSGQRAAFFVGLAIVFLTLNGPLHDLSDYYLFSAHMIQHLILTLIVPPLLILGTPGWMLRPLLRNASVFRLAKVMTSTAGCFLIFNGVLAVWHLPPLYNLAIANHPIHILQHLMFLAASVFMWWPLTSQLPELPRAAYPAQLMYCFLLTVPMGIIAIFVSMAEDLLYPAYAIAPRIWGMSPMQDQQYGGLIMWIPGALFFYGVMSVVFFKWQQRDADDAGSAQVGSVAPAAV